MHSRAQASNVPDMFALTLGHRFMVGVRTFNQRVELQSEAEQIWRGEPNQGRTLGAKQGFIMRGAPGD
ncbi:hypothetical protein SKAU_G00052310 [Synaphobranchus kaupii]|uniref:Uncharacterized protein n=1 Tax=Synaphobranchus kaupii TaxID=118154 RepID=A0A9Q1G3Q7_SYNKA|nr:hypothetical protein SKAU_G00052310 [Synaphobranchus kaupii]